MDSITQRILVVACAVAAAILFMSRCQSASNDYAAKRDLINYSIRNAQYIILQENGKIEVQYRNPSAGGSSAYPQEPTTKPQH